MARRIEQRVEQTGQALHFLDHQVDPFLMLAVAELGAQIAERHLQPGERIAQLVRDRGGELAGGRQALGARQAALLLEQLMGGGVHLGFQ